MCNRQMCVAMARQGVAATTAEESAAAGEAASAAAARRRMLVMRTWSPAPRCKVVLVGDSRCGKTALISVFAKERFPENYVPTVFENYTATFEIERQTIELNMWDTSGSPYYDNVRPLSYPDSDAVLICFDISRPETLDSVLKKWHREIHEFCPSTEVLLIGCKADLRAEADALRDPDEPLAGPVSYDQGFNASKQMGAAGYMECSAKTSENGVRDLFRMATLASVGRGPGASGKGKGKKSKTTRGSGHRRGTSAGGGTPAVVPPASSMAAALRRRLSQLPQSSSGSDIGPHPQLLRSVKAKSCTIM
ncbi:rho-related GTP-binding protein RhoE-like isoform X2 [Lethenteron reissneri]|uniref:rho-related GTP-binding protein RhoE-like isoform X2 n=1 Tax=Lethenteron reissneri TaxID=7753 RepID=UPI002AB6BF80|nr:rho-related GTP-binding protein RhoE-like isoform X2 [Lethenteron reissneri]